MASESKPHICKHKSMDWNEIFSDDGVALQQHFMRLVGWWAHRHEQGQQVSPPEELQKLPQAGKEMMLLLLHAIEPGIFKTKDPATGEHIQHLATECMNGRGPNAFDPMSLWARVRSGVLSGKTGTQL